MQTLAKVQVHKMLKHWNNAIVAFCTRKFLWFWFFIKKIESYQFVFRCDLGDKFCEGTCNAIGRRNGTCTTLESGKKDCTCSDDYLTPKEFALCAAETTCYLNCKAQGFGSGKCVGWKCTCEQKDELWFHLIFSSSYGGGLFYQ